MNYNEWLYKIRAYSYSKGYAHLVRTPENFDFKGRQNFSISQRKHYQNPVNWFLRGIVASNLMSLSILATWEFQFTVSVAGRLISRIAATVWLSAQDINRMLWLIHSGLLPRTHASRFSEKSFHRCVPSEASRGRTPLLMMFLVQQK